jgi:hypothetical protein
MTSAGLLAYPVLDFVEWKHPALAKLDEGQPRLQELA